MATLKELMGDKTRGDGRKFRRSDFAEDAWFEPIFKAYDCGEEVFCGIGQDGESYSYSLHKRTDWQEWTPPKKTKKVVLYRPVFKRKNQEVYRMGVWVSQKTVTSTQYYTIGMNGRQWWDVVSWQEMEVEVEE
jgi:hypothetical protein